MENIKKYTTCVKLRQKIERIIQKIYITFAQYAMLFFILCQKTNDGKLIFNASKLPL